MTATGASVASLLFEILAVAALGSTLLRAGRRDAVTDRFLTNVVVMLVLMTSRLVFHLSGSGIALFVSVTAGGTLPLVALLVAEALMRRHAPLALKMVAALGVFAGVLLLLPDGPAVLGLYQIGVLLGVGSFVVMRPRDSLGPGENGLVDGVGLSLLPLLPLLLFDAGLFNAPPPVPTVGLALVSLCWLAIALHRNGARIRELVAEFLAVALGGATAGAAVALACGLRGAAAFVAVLLVTTAAISIQALVSSMALRRPGPSTGLLSIATDPALRSAPELLAALQSRPTPVGVRTFGEDDLDEFGHDTLIALFASSPVLVRTAGDVEASSGSELDHLFDACGSSHLLLASSAPVVILAVDVPALSSSAAVEAELAAVQRIVSLAPGRIEA